ncbi:ammonium transporter [Salegentibacter salegens]|jgi:Amt family ammonium transporter|uniref:Ammonium transporter n=1 Tax=Salegentibacter salegens TaxID=143223 RepID=A0A1M7NQI0_9FLAO|nr:ammonium transporter [Salegentibacter salegens]PRX41068.1 Amt family ammonium transporter [Salegentibacter salegens]SHN06353.1 ammonium transporter [Salegentibacter salegens]
MELLTTNNVWMMVCTALVFFMHLGFSLLEVGLTRQKNAINILFKNVFIICAGLLTYAILGFNLMYPGSFIAGIVPDYFFDLFGLSAPMANGSLDLAYNGGYTYWTDFLFQGMFAATAATIVSGAVAERIRLGSFMLFSVIYITIVYPIVGSWKWGGGFLDGLGFYDFAGSTLVHSVGGWAALIAIYLLGARLGKFGKEGQSHAIPGHNIPLATAGVFILWLGWFGFNGGSVLSADPSLTSITLVTTCLAAAAGGISAFLVSTIAYKNYDLTMFLNGILGGLVGITAGADLMSPLDAVLIGLVAGGVIVFGVSLIDRLKLDDPVGAVAVHLACGIWGTLAVGIFGSMAGFDQLLIQLAGVGIIGAFCCISAFIILSIIKATMGLRMEEKEETEGLDAHEHGMDAYAEFGTVHDR